MVRDYELMYIVRPDLEEEAVQAAADGVQALVEGQGGEVVKTTSWGKRRLAYEIERMRDGHYYILHIRLDPTRVKDVERLLAISDTVFRHLVTIWVPERDEADGRRERDGAGEAGGPGAPAATPVPVAAGEVDGDRAEDATGEGVDDVADAGEVEDAVGAEEEE